MKRLAFLSFTIATLIAPIQVQAQQYDPAGNCVRFPEIPNAEAELQYLLSHPHTRGCPARTDLQGQADTVAEGMRKSAIYNRRLLDAMSGYR
jgi:hypothetical protein